MYPTVPSTTPAPVAGVSVGLLVAGIVSPRVGRFIAGHGGRPVLAIGAVLLAAGLALLGFAPNLACYLAAWAIVGAGMGAAGSPGRR